MKTKTETQNYDINVTIKGCTDVGGMLAVLQRSLQSCYHVVKHLLIIFKLWNV